jgi:hypothetical protein
MHEVGVVHNAIESVFAHVFVKVVEGIIAQSCMKSTNFYAPQILQHLRCTESQRDREKERRRERSRARERGMRERGVPQKLWMTALFWLADDA